MPALPTGLSRATVRPGTTTLPPKTTITVKFIYQFSLLACLLNSSCQTAGTGGELADAQILAELNSSEAIERVLLSRGFEKVEFDRMATGHALLLVRINGSDPQRFICDSGSGASIMFPALAEELGLTATSNGSRAGGIGGQGMELKTVGIESLSIGGVEFSDRTFSVLDLSHLNRQFSAAGEAPIQGIIGAPWLSSHEVVIDEAANTLFARP